MQTKIFKGNQSVGRAYKAIMAPVLGMMLCMIALPMYAQYTGPAGGGYPGENKPTTLTTDQNILRPQTHDFLIGQGDLLMISVYAVTEFNQSLRVMPDGSLTLPLIGVVNVNGLNTTQAAQLIAKKLKDSGMVKNPQVTVTVVDAPNLVATVAGEVRLPGLVSVVGQRSLIEVITAAGGLTPTGSHVITILRPGVQDPITVDLGSDPARSGTGDIPIFAGDRILVPRVGVVYTYGASKLQSAFPLNNSTPLTLMQLCAMAGGIPFEAERTRTHIIRTIGTKRQEVTVDMKKVIEGTAPDPILQADDIVYIPTSDIKAAIHAGGVSTVLAGVIGLQTFH
jgi:polysaccharide export outer membrane protein